MSATAFQKKRRELREQTSVGARMNEKGQYDPYAKADENYDAVGVKDTGEEHQAGNPPPYSLTPHTPEELQAASHLGDPDNPESYEPETDEGQRQHDENDPPLTSVELREDEEPEEVKSDPSLDEPDIHLYKDQREYGALDKREAPTAEASEANVDLSEPELDESGLPYEVNATQGAREYADEQGIDLASVEGTGQGGRITKADVEKA